jgi:hypothetical protein
MWTVKRFAYLIGFVVFAALLVAPFGLSGSVKGISLNPHTALASFPGAVTVPAATPTPASDFLGMPGCVQIAVPLVDNGGKCVNNSAASGGAIIAYLRGWLLILSGVVGTVIMVVIVVAGVQYITSTGDPGLVKAAKNRIFNAILALLLYLMMYAILQFLVPGGIL